MTLHPEFCWHFLRVHRDRLTIALRGHRPSSADLAPLVDRIAHAENVPLQDTSFRDNLLRAIASDFDTGQSAQPLG